MVSYIVVSSSNLINLADRVNEMMKEGYKPLGSLTIGGAGFLQAMIK